MEFFFKKILHRREGLIALIASIAYLAFGVFVELTGYKHPTLGFVGLVAPFMPFVLLIYFFQIGGFKDSYRSSFLNTSCISAMALAPLIAIALP